MVFRSTVVALLCAGLVLSGRAPAAPADVVPPTVSERVHGLPSAPVAARAGEPQVSLASSMPIPFSLIGFAFPAGARVEFRTSTDGDAWSGWSEAPPLGADHGPDPRTTEAAGAVDGAAHSEPLWVGEARWLQVRVAGAGPGDVTVDVIDSLGLSRSVAGRAVDTLRASWRGSGRQAAAQAGRPGIVSRAQWGADESLRSGSPDYASRVRMGVVHHTATANTYSQAEAPGVVRGIYRYHTTSLGWDDIGYNLLIDRFGTVYEGRHGGLESGVVGAHASGWNTGTFGVSVMGCFDSQACTSTTGGSGGLPAPAEEALLQVLAWKYDVHHIDVQATIDMNGTRKPTLVGHRDVGQTSCPGDRFHGKLAELRRKVAALQAGSGGVIVDPGASPSSTFVRDGRLEREITFSARLRPPAPWTLRVTDGEGRTVHSASGSGETAIVRWAGGPGVRGGTHTYAFASQGRRTATGGVALQGCSAVFCDIGATVHRDAIISLHASGVTKGCTAFRYCPAGQTSRGQMATLIARALGISPQGNGHFDDVPDDHPHAAGINALHEAGVVEGVDERRFLPGAAVRRDQMATFIKNALRLPDTSEDHFTDVAGNTHEAAINALAARGIARGDGGGRYHPALPIRRDQAASLLQRALSSR